MVAPTRTLALVFVSLILPLLFMAAINVIMGIIAVNMAKKRGLRTVPAFFSGFFGSFIALFFIAMFPINRQY